MKAIRIPLEARPLALNNNDNKAVCGLSAMGMAPVLHKVRRKFQKHSVKVGNLLTTLCGRVLCSSTYIAHESMFLSVAPHNTLATSTLGYIALLASRPDGLRRLEVCVSNRILHLATNSLSLAFTTCIL